MSAFAISARGREIVANCQALKRRAFGEGCMLQGAAPPALHAESFDEVLDSTDFLISC